MSEKGEVKEKGKNDDKDDIRSLDGFKIKRQSMQKLGGSR